MTRLPPLLVWLCVAAVAASPAAAQTPPPPSPCAYVAPKPRPSAFGRTVRGGQAVRREFDLRADRAWVLRVLRSPRSRFVEGFGLASARERRYLALRDRVADASDVAAAYLREHAAVVDGGISIEDDGRRGPYVLVRLTGDRARIEPALRARFPLPDNLRFADVTYSERELDALADRISDDGERLEREGLSLSAIGPDISLNRVAVELITARTDAQAVLAERYSSRR